MQLSTNINKMFSLLLHYERLILLNINVERDLQLPLAWLISETLNIVWNSRTEKKACTLFLTRATLEANIMLLRKTRHSKAVEKIVEIMSSV